MTRFATLVVCLFTLVGCSLTSADRGAYRDAAIGELTYRIEQLQAIDPDTFTVEVDPIVLIGADAACSFIAVGSPFLVDAINKRIEAEESKVTVAEFQASLHAVCDLVRTVMIEKNSAAPLEAPLPPQPIA